METRTSPLKGTRRPVSWAGRALAPPSLWDADCSEDSSWISFQVKSAWWGPLHTPHPSTECFFFAEPLPWSASPGRVSQALQCSGAGLTHSTRSLVCEASRGESGMMSRCAADHHNQQLSLLFPLQAFTAFKQVHREPAQFFLIPAPLILSLVFSQHITVLCILNCLFFAMCFFFKSQIPFSEFI